MIDEWSKQRVHRPIEVWLLEAWTLPIFSSPSYAISLSFPSFCPQTQPNFVLAVIYFVYTFPQVFDLGFLPLCSSRRNHSSWRRSSKSKRCRHGRISGIYGTAISWVPFRPILLVRTLSLSLSLTHTHFSNFAFYL